MTVQRSQFSENAARELQKTHDRPRDPTRDKPDKDAVDRFRGLMDKPGGTGKDGKLLVEKKPGDERGLRKGESEAAQADDSTAAADSAKLVTTDAAVQRRDDRGDGGGGDGMPPAELAALMQAQVLARDASAVAQSQQAPMPSGAQSSLADLLEKHVRQLAVSPGGAHATDDGQVLLRLADDTLPGTDLLLSKVEGGWVLRADVNSRSSYDAIRDAAPGLAERFKSKNLGTLHVDPVLHG